MFVPVPGQRKVRLGMFYLAVCTGLCALAMTKAYGDPLSLGTMCVGLATGVGVIVWGNVQEHRAKNGG